MEGYKMNGNKPGYFSILKRASLYNGFLLTFFLNNDF